MPPLILTLSCKDVIGIVAAVSNFLADHQGFILESAQFGDSSTGQFFMRTEFTLTGDSHSPESLRRDFSAIAARFGMVWDIADTAKKPRVALLVSKQGHCFNDLLHRVSTGGLKMEIPLVISNHEEMRRTSEWYGIPFHHLPVTAATKMEQEMQVWELLQKEKIDLVVLARYMQILSAGLVGKLTGKAINIHHSFLPSFKGAKPYHQAYARGVKLIGATAHYVSDDLDEGPIIEQETVRVDHTYTPEELTRVGSDVESQVLARAITYHIQHRVLLNGTKTVVFR